MMSGGSRSSSRSAIWSVVNGIDAEVKSRGIDLLVMTRGLSGVQVRGDDSRLQWALGHLIRNGASYNSEGGYVALAARAELRDAKAYALISVSDNGVGISGEDLPHIFERFYRGRSERCRRQTARPGAGLVRGAGDLSGAWRLPGCAEPAQCRQHFHHGRTGVFGGGGGRMMMARARLNRLDLVSAHALLDRRAQSHRSACRISTLMTRTMKPGWSTS